eukprot:TRINITY_DN9615_c0_g1_i6.p1 TRINITY_DN9615_c0_g1~~TRINITY_DN9615_c0_g1_i6.p1  ORF type:complete len:399 (+),score=70.17 TRINITY_DN9615_c0_g1_i6:61-1197(+)
MCIRDRSKPLLAPFLVIFFVAYSVVAADWRSYTHKHDLRFTANGQYSILQITDLHLGPNLEADNGTYHLISLLLNSTQPDLVVITGDLVTAGEWDKKSPDYFQTPWSKLEAIFAQHKQRYAIILGNHDTEGDLNCTEIMELDASSEWSVSQPGPRNVLGGSNYLVQIESAYNKSHPALNLWMFDSHDIGCENIQNSYGCVEKSQLKWYEDLSVEVEKKHGNSASSMHIAFVHIPLPEFVKVFNEAEVFGEKDEWSSCPVVNTGLFELFRKRRDVRAVYVGHDHKNHFGGEHEGIELVYGLKTGYGSYGPALGARLMRFTEDPKSGEVSKQEFTVDLNGEIKQVDKKTRKNTMRQVMCAPPHANPITSMANGLYYFRWL